MIIGFMKCVNEILVKGSVICGGIMIFEVDDCDVSYKWVLDNGGVEVLLLMDYSGIGCCVYVEDG